MSSVKIILNEGLDISIYYSILYFLNEGLDISIYHVYYSILYFLDISIDYSILYFFHSVLSYYQDKRLFFNLEHTTAPLDNILFFMCLIASGSELQFHAFKSRSDLTK